MCSICNKLECPTGCPNYSPIIGDVCDVCGEPIIFGDEYVENDVGDKAHIDCMYMTRFIIEWFGHEIKTMGDNYD